MKKLLLFLISLTAALSLQASVGKYADISHDDLKAVLASGKVTLIDVNGSESYAQGHIPAALDFDQIKSALAAKLPKEKDALIVAYCGGPHCTAYRQAYDAALALGYTNVKHYSGGLSGWVQKGEKLAKP